LNRNTISEFREIWFVDFEFSAPSGERPIPICMVAWELNTGRKMEIWQDELQKMSAPPYSIDKKSLFVAYYASAEMGCHLTLKWPLPEMILDLYIEFRNLTNGRPTPCGNSLLGALAWFGIDSLDAIEKEKMRDLALRGGPYTQDEKIKLIDYCTKDVRALFKLFPKMVPSIDIPRALLRGRYMKATAQIEHNGIPIDTKMLNQFKDKWDLIRGKLIRKIDGEYGIFDGLIFKRELFEKWLTKAGIPWPRLESGALDLSDEVFKEMSKSCPVITPLRELRVTLSKMRLSKLAV
jgi:hypothetical protein